MWLYTRSSSPKRVLRIEKHRPAGALSFRESGPQPSVGQARAETRHRQCIDSTWLNTKSIKPCAVYALSRAWLVHPVYSPFALCKALRDRPWLGVAAALGFSWSPPTEPSFPGVVILGPTGVLAGRGCRAGGQGLWHGSWAGVGLTIKTSWLGLGWPDRLVAMGLVMSDRTLVTG